MLNALTMIPALLQSDEAAGAAAALFGGLAFVMMIVWLVVMLAIIVGCWKVFEKAGQPGWAILIPIFNILTLLKIAGKPAWWILLLIIPAVNIVIALLIALDIAKAFGQSTAFGLLLLIGIGYLILGFGDYRYIGPPVPATA